MNSASFIGNLCATPISRQSKTGTPYITFDIAVNEGKDRPALFISCIRTGDNSKLLPYLEKGKKIYVRGRISSHAYIDRNNQAQSSLDLSVYEIELLSSNTATTQQQTAPSQPQPQSSPRPFPPSSAPQVPDPTDTDNLPF